MPRYIIISGGLLFREMGTTNITGILCVLYLSILIWPILGEDDEPSSMYHAYDDNMFVSGYNSKSLPVVKKRIYGDTGKREIYNDISSMYKRQQSTQISQRRRVKRRVFFGPGTKGNDQFKSSTAPYVDPDNNTVELIETPAQKEVLTRIVNGVKEPIRGILRKPGFAKSAGFKKKTVIFKNEPEVHYYDPKSKLPVSQSIAMQKCYDPYSCRFRSTSSLRTGLRHLFYQ